MTWRVESQAPADDVDAELTYDVVLASLPPQARVVDAGCGMGKWPIALRRLGHHAVGLDLSRAALELARDRDPAVPLVVADARCMPLRSHVLDAVLSEGVVEHEEEGPLASLRELHRVLKPGGTLILDVPYDNWLRRLVMNHLQTWVTARRRRAGWTLGFSEYRYTHREVLGFLEAAGFEPISAHPNDRKPPKNVGVWVDYHNLIFDPFKPTPPATLFVLPPLATRIIGPLIHRVPWLLCGTITVIARAR
ncbi:MAG TPA: methyltransferase domain-containing protein [Candidatus Limnocylindria bacterium]|nr:methyltransferase domain-containing protein [Candidatus Limnocylindria bacterium]